jgi:hypothetical protein
MGLGNSLLHMPWALKGKAMAAAGVTFCRPPVHTMQTGRKAYRFRPALFGVAGGYLLLPLLPLPPLLPLSPMPLELPPRPEPPLDPELPLDP